MKTHNFCMFVLTALFCGALFCVPANAKVCFVGDEDCGTGSAFSPMTPPDTSSQCSQEGYTTKASACNNIGAVCPYDASYVKCCSAEYAYQACVYPLETVTKVVAGKNVIDKCGSLYNCQCNSEYKTPGQWNVSEKKCQPGGGICIKNNEDTVYYNKCVCDSNYFPYTECKDGMTASESCTDSDGVTHYNCQCPVGYRTCVYGGAPGAKTCKQGGTILYSSCKSAEDECTNAGYYKDCNKQTCYYDTNSTIKDKGSYPTNCEDSYEACPYAYGYYKCRWSAANYCAKWDMTEYSKTLPSTCTKDGVEGTVIPCNLGGSYNGGGSTKNYLGYYRCKLTCEQQARGAVSQGYLTVNSNIVDSKGNLGFIRTDSAGKHLYLIGDIGRPKWAINTNINWNNDAMTGENYASVNGINALYDVDSKRYSSCAENRSYDYRPTLFLDNKRIEGGNDNWIMDVDFSDINIKFVMNSGDGDGKENYKIEKPHTWKNVGILTSTGRSGLDAVGIPSTGVLRTSSSAATWKDVVRDDNRNKISVRKGVDLVFTGDITFRLGNYAFSKYKNDIKHQNGWVSYTNFYMDGGKAIIFKDAVIDSHISDDWDAASDATMIFINSRGTMGKVWSQWNVGLSNSDINASMLYVQGFNNKNTTRQIGGMFTGNIFCNHKTTGVYLTNSTLRLGRNQMWTSTIVNDSDYGKLYISPDSKVVLNGPIWLSKGSSICIPQGKGTTWATSTKGGYRLEVDTGGAIAPNRCSIGRYANFYYYGAGDKSTCMPVRGECDSTTYGRGTCLGNLGDGGNWRGVSEWNPGWGGPEKSLLMPACYNMQICGMRY